MSRDTSCSAGVSLKRMKPAVQRAGDERHDHPGQEGDHAAVENSAAEKEWPRSHRCAQGQVQNRGGGQDTEKSCKRHLPTRRRTLRRAKPRFESVQRSGAPRTLLRQRLTFRLPRFEDRRGVKSIALLLIGERAQDAKLTRI